MVQVWLPDQIAEHKGKTPATTDQHHSGRTPNHGHFQGLLPVDRRIWHAHLPHNAASAAMSQVVTVNAGGAVVEQSTDHPRLQVMAESMLRATEHCIA